MKKLDRRRFVGALGMAAGSVAAASLCPLVLHASSRGLAVSELAPYAKTGPLKDWTIDDMTAPYPRYAQAISYSRSRAGLVHSDPLDYL